MAKGFQLLLFVCFSLVRSEVLDLDHRFFLMQIIEKYGHNGTISYQGFERLYRNLGLGHSRLETDESGLSTAADAPATPDPVLSRPVRDVSNSSTSKECTSQQELDKLVRQHGEVLPDPKSLHPPPQRCLSSRELLAVYGLRGPVGSLSPVSFLHLCPAIVYELDQRTCVWGKDEDNHVAERERGSVLARWLFACLTVVFISVSGLIVVALVPLLHKSLVSQVIGFLVALAVGTLLGDAFLHLIPHALGGGDSHSRTDSIIKTGLMFLTVVFFFTFEAVLNIIRNGKEGCKKQDNVSYMSVNINQNEKEMMEMGHEHTHSHSYSHSPHNNVALMVIMGDGLHNLTDGLAIGAAFTGGLAPGFATAVAVFTHELPHELGDFAVLLQSGVSVRQALLYNLLSSALSFLGTVVGLIIGNFGDATRWIYAITAGSFIYIALSNLVPEINKKKPSFWTISLQLSGIVCGGALMACIAMFEHDIQHFFL